METITVSLTIANTDNTTDIGLQKLAASHSY